MLVFLYTPGHIKNQHLFLTIGLVESWPSKSKDCKVARKKNEFQFYFCNCCVFFAENDLLIPSLYNFSVTSKLPQSYHGQPLVKCSPSRSSRLRCWVEMQENPKEEVLVTIYSSKYFHRRVLLFLLVAINLLWEIQRSLLSGLQAPQITVKWHYIHIS